MDRLAKSDGFTLVEMIIVLHVLMIISVFMFYNLSNMYKNQQIENFFEVFQNDILYSQTYAMTHGNLVKVYFNLDNHSYSIRSISQNEEVILKRTYIDQINIVFTSLQLPIVFLSTGNIKQAGKFYVTYDDQLFKVVFLLGKGRFYVEKL